jgi:putative nucleotidyltransferase with HDIG domain
VLPGNGVALVLETTQPEGTGEAYRRTESGGRSGPVPVDTTWLGRITADADHARVEFPTGTPDAESALAVLGEPWDSSLVVPLRLKSERLGFFVTAHPGEWEYSESDLGRARQIADQITVALANARLINDLERLTWGALTALARAIDAKSPWTSGHSERVTTLAVKVGRAMDLDPEALETLRRAGLLHDVGKIGIPGRVLDKPKGLTPEEVHLMQSHTTVGARILEPIDVLNDVVPVAMHHHEWYDGTGYPDGLAGDEIPLLARVLSVADVYDALTSDRPYRDGLDPEVAVRIIREGAGTQFDPKIVEVFANLNHAAPTPHAAHETSDAAS